MTDRLTNRPTDRLGQRAVSLPKIGKEIWDYVLSRWEKRDLIFIYLWIINRFEGKTILMSNIKYGVEKKDIFGVHGPKLIESSPSFRAYMAAYSVSKNFRSAK